MFRIAPVQTEEEKREVTSSLGIPSRDGAFVYAMRDMEDGHLLGGSQFDIAKDGGTLFDLRPAPGIEDFEAMFILGRATLDFIDRTGTHLCRAAKDAGEERLLRAVGFRPSEDGGYLCDMTGMFDGHCDGHALDLHTV
ncbi:MAG TPA: hypothetical protein DDY70_06580 [Clostridiales bacterium]|nr:hypothetical protein [Clostridiales bacterium]